MNEPELIAEMLEDLNRRLSHLEMLGESVCEADDKKFLELKKRFDSTNTITATMKEVVKVRLVAGSAVISLPLTLLEAVGLKVGAKVSLKVDGNRLIISKF